LAGALTSSVAGSLPRGPAGRSSSFLAPPSIHLFLAPAHAMRLCADAPRSGTTVLLATRPPPAAPAVPGNFRSAWVFIGIAAAPTRNQVIALVLAASISFLCLTAGVEVVQRFLGAFLPMELASAVAGLSFQTHFQMLSQGVIELKDVIFFLSLIVAALIVNTLV